MVYGSVCESAVMDDECRVRVHGGCGGDVANISDVV